jgi:two-component system, chemotaxis family, protein-glutamate methylesterase/glutaminase
MYKALAIGTSAGGIEALNFLLPRIPPDSKVPVFVVQHITHDSDSYFIKMIKDHCQVNVKEACHTEEIIPGVIYFAPPDYHLAVENDKSLAISHEDKVNYCRPSIDILFETAADVYTNGLTGILLTGSNTDGSRGLKYIQTHGGRTIVQSPSDAMMSEMPESALRLFKPDAIMTLKEIAFIMEKLNE